MDVLGVRLTPNMVIATAFFGVVASVVALNYISGVLLQGAFNVRFFQDASWSGRELLMIAWAVAVFYGVWGLVRFAQSVLNQTDAADLYTCFPTSVGDALVTVGIPFLAALLMLFTMGKM